MHVQRPCQALLEKQSQIELVLHQMASSYTPTHPIVGNFYFLPQCQEVIQATPLPIDPDLFLARTRPVHCLNYPSRERVTEMVIEIIGLG